MPTYLCHGFRWYRRSIRIFVILNDLDDVAPDWIAGRTSAALILSQFAESFDFVPRLENEDGTITRVDSDMATPTQESRPHFYDDDLSMPTSRVPASEDSVLMHEWSPVKLLEEYDMNETEHAARQYAYVADHVVRVDLGADIAAEMAKYETTHKGKQLSWFEKLRAQIQAEEQSRWYVVVCDDGEREAPEEEEEEDDDNRDILPVEEAPRQPPQPQPRAVSRAGASSVASDRPSSGDAFRSSSQNRGKQTLSQHAFLDQDPFKSDFQPPPRLKKKLSIRRLFSRKDSKTDAG